MALAALRSTQFRALLLVARAAVVWAAELALWYGAASPDGEPFGAHGALAAAGYAVIIAVVVAAAAQPGAGAPPRGDAADAQESAPAGKAP